MGAKRRKEKQGKQEEKERHAEQVRAQVQKQVASLDPVGGNEPTVPGPKAEAETKDKADAKRGTIDFECQGDETASAAVGDFLAAQLQEQVASLDGSETTVPG